MFFFQLLTLKKCKCFHKNFPAPHITRKHHLIFTSCTFTCRFPFGMLAIVVIQSFLTLLTLSNINIFSILHCCTIYSNNIQVAQYFTLLSHFEIFLSIVYQAVLLYNISKGYRYLFQILNITVFIPHFYSIFFNHVFSL